MLRPAASSEELSHHHAFNDRRVVDEALFDLARGAPGEGQHHHARIALGARKVDDTKDMSCTRVRNRRRRARQRGQRVGEVLAAPHKGRASLGDRSSDCIRANRRLLVHEPRREMHLIKTRAERPLR